jgi:hypothetical protein
MKKLVSLLKSGLRLSFVLAVGGLAAVSAPAQAPNRNLVDPKAGARYDKAKAALDETTKFFLEAKGAREKLSQLVPSERKRLEEEFQKLEEKVAGVNKKIEKANADLDKFRADVAARNKDANKTEADFEAFRQRATKILTEGSEVREAASKAVNPLAIKFVADVERALKAVDTVKEYASKRVGYDDSAKKPTDADRKKLVEAEKKKLTDTAKTLIDKQKENYAADAEGRTKCNIFLRDYVKELTGVDMPEFASTALYANDMFDNLKESRNFRPLDLRKDPKAVFREAQDLANEGKLVIVAYKNSSGPGHVAVVVPNDAGLAEPGEKSTWHVPVPYLAQAGRKIHGEYVHDKLPLDEAIGAGKLPNMEIFVFDPRSK